ncbi:MAG: hypothetical protein WC697_02145 [Patescibacteria group bacterium]
MTKIKKYAILYKIKKGGKMKKIKLFLKELERKVCCDIGFLIMFLKESRKYLLEGIGFMAMLVFVLMLISCAYEAADPSFLMATDISKLIHLPYYSGWGIVIGLIFIGSIAEEKREKREKRSL